MVTGQPDQKKEGNNWKTIFTDHDTCTTYQWKRDFIANSKITITWNIPADTKFAEYRICHNGDAKDNSGKVKAYSGVSGTFRVGEAISVNEINFKNSYGSLVELWFYHPQDWMKWSAYAKHILKKDE